MDYKNMDTEALNRMLLHRIGELQQQKLVNHQFQQCYSLKENTGHSFFLDVILMFLNNVEAVITDMEEIILNKEVMDFNKLYSAYIKLKGSSACFGACRITSACSNLCHAIDNKSKDRCVEGLNLLKDEHKNLRDELSSIIKIEQELVSRSTA